MSLATLPNVERLFERAGVALLLGLGVISGVALVLVGT